MKYFRLRGAAEEAKSNFGEGEYLEGLASIAKLTGKSVANVGLLAGRLLGSAIENRETILGEVASVMLKGDLTNISSADREKLDEFVKRGERASESGHSKQDLKEAFAGFLNGTHAARGISANDEILVEICKRYSERRPCTWEQAHEQGASAKEHEQGLSREISYFFAEDIPAELEAPFRYKNELRSTEYVYFLSDLNRNETFGDAFAVTNRGIYALSGSEARRGEFASRLIPWAELAKLKVSGAFTDKSYQGVYLSDRTILLCTKRNLGILSYCEFFIAELAKKSKNLKSE